MKKIYLIKGLFLLAALLFGGFFYYLQLRSSASNNVNSVRNLEAELPKASSLEAKSPSESMKEIKLLFLGDLMFDRYIRQVAEKKGYDFIFGDTDKILAGNDLVIGNLEGPITDNQSVSITSEFGARENYIFTFDPQAADVLKKHNINLVNIGNNHILNFNQDGLAQTEKYLNEAEIKFFCDKNIRCTIYQMQDTKLGFVCYNQFEADAENKTLSDIADAKKQADVVILYAHWGKEYETAPLEKTKVLAHKFIDVGVDLIIGSHPHVVQELEIYKRKTIYPHTKENDQEVEVIKKNNTSFSNNWTSPDLGVRVYYSLGNFIFDQYFDPNATQGLAVEVVINPKDKSLDFQEYKLQLKNNGQTTLK
jgi:poly-gamma-glutamate capsule biosynthesis protein CapA/YwtB (metallophosphatase superfamily)